MIETVILWLKEQKKYVFIMSIISFILVVSVMVCGVILFKKDTPPQHVEQAFVQTSQVVDSNERVVVDVKGAVHKPGVYTLEKGKRVIDAIEKAGGFRHESDKERVNLSQLLVDEMVIVIGQVQETLTVQSTKINVNVADEKTLMTVQGIGQAKAKAIIDYRKTHGKFKTIDELKNVKGISQALLLKLKEMIVAQ